MPAISNTNTIAERERRDSFASIASSAEGADLSALEHSNLAMSMDFAQESDRNSVVGDLPEFSMPAGFLEKKKLTEASGLGASLVTQSTTATFPPAMERSVQLGGSTLQASSVHFRASGTLDLGSLIESQASAAAPIVTLDQLVPDTRSSSAVARASGAKTPTVTDDAVSGESSIVDSGNSEVRVVSSHTTTSSSSSSDNSNSSPSDDQSQSDDAGSKSSVVMIPGKHLGPSALEEAKESKEKKDGKGQDGQDIVFCQSVDVIETKNTSAFILGNHPLPCGCPTRGSYMHYSKIDPERFGFAKCRVCVFHRKFKEGKAAQDCKDGEDCEFCHLSHEPFKKNKKKKQLVGVVDGSVVTVAVAKERYQEAVGSGHGSGYGSAASGYGSGAGSGPGSSHVSPKGSPVPASSSLKGNGKMLSKGGKGKGKMLSKGGNGKGAGKKGGFKGAGKVATGYFGNYGDHAHWGGYAYDQAYYGAQMQSHPQPQYPVHYHSYPAPGYGYHQPATETAYPPATALPTGSVTRSLPSSASSQTTPYRLSLDANVAPPASREFNNSVGSSAAAAAAHATRAD